MRNVVIKFILSMMILLAVGCTNNESSRLSAQNGKIQSKVVIKGYYDEPVSMGDKKTLILDGVSKGEFIEIAVQGEIKDFEHVRLEWDENKKVLVDKETINRFDKLIDQIIIIKTYMPEGIPSEKIKWRSVSGKKYEFIIAEYSLDGETENKWEFDLE